MPSLRDILLQHDDDMRAIQQDAEFLDAMRDALNSEPDNDDCLTTFVGFGLGAAILLQTALQFV